MAKFLERTCSVVSGERRNTFTTIWKIHYPTESCMITAVLSPEFNLDFLNTTYWRLGIIRTEDLMSLILYRSRKGPETVEIDFELSLLTLGDLPQRVLIRRNHTFERQEHYVYENFLRPEDIFESNVHLFLVNNSLTVRCRMWQASKEVRPIQCFISTVFIKERISFNLPIENYTVLPRSLPYDVCIGPPFREKILLKLLLAFDPETQCLDHVNISVHCINLKKLSRLICTIVIVDDDGEVLYNMTEDCPRCLWMSTDFIWNFSHFNNMNLLVHRKYTPSHENVLTFRFEFVFWWCRDDECDLRFYGPSYIQNQPIASCDEFSDPSCPATPTSHSPPVLGEVFDFQGVSEI